MTSRLGLTAKTRSSINAQEVRANISSGAYDSQNADLRQLARTNLGTVGVAQTPTSAQILGGLIQLNASAPLTITLPSVETFITALATAGISGTTGTKVTCIVYNSGANNATITADAGAQWTITGTAAINAASGVCTFVILSATTGVVHVAQ